jgi:hypothetical protein
MNMCGGVFFSCLQRQPGQVPLASPLGDISVYDLLHGRGTSVHDQKDVSLYFFFWERHRLFPW